MKKRKSPVSVIVLSYLFSVLSTFVFCYGANNITIGQTITDGETLVSSNGFYELGFFSPKNSELRYVGITYAHIREQALIWIANRDAPISDRNGVLSIHEDGNLVVRDDNGNFVWSSSNVSLASNDTVLVLENTGNLILSSIENVGDTVNAYWQSFDHPTDTFLPGMKAILGSKEIRVLSSWKSENDPSTGNFTMGLDPRGAPQIIIWDGSVRRWRSGQWNGQIFTGVPYMSVSTTYRYGFKITQETDGNLSITYNPSNESEVMRFELSWDGYEKQTKWNETEQQWDLLTRQPETECELYNHCGNFGVCNFLSGSARCSCLEGYEPSNRDQWSRGNWSGGCKRRSQLQCQRNASDAERTGEDGFKQIGFTKLPDFADVEPGLALDDCQDKCLRNCSCSSFALISGIGCMTWSGDLIDMQTFDKAGNSFYLRLADSEFSSKKLSTAVIVIIVVAGVIFVAISIWLLWKLRSRLKANSASRIGEYESGVSELNKGKEYSTDFSGTADIAILEGSHPDLPMFNFNSLATATDDFSEENKLGHGGFGDVFKGKLPGGEEVAVKRLSKISGQGLEEFKNEMILIAKLQHRNLVRLLGCCIHGEEKLLVYEYMPNKSLDYLLFDPEKQTQLSWRQRFSIIEGIARGLLYLHRDSRLRIIHRDLKASNILLDGEMNPKISDFGMARIFGGNQNEANTNRVVGTYGYMSPEYAMEGLFSVKSDVYSFGVLMLEIISGRRNISFRFSNHLSLVAYAWQLWEEKSAMELIDPSIKNRCSENEVLRCIQVGFLCVQDSPIHRPSMDKVLLMLDTETSTLPLPRAPTFTSMRNSEDTEINLELVQEIVSSNDLTFTSVIGR